MKIRIKDNITVKKDKHNNIFEYLKNKNQEQIAENQFYIDSQTESSKAKLYKSLLMKYRSLEIFDDMVTRFNINLVSPLLELGGGYGFLSTYIKEKYKVSDLIYSDVAKEAVIKSTQFEKFFGVTLDEKWVVAAENTPFENNSFSTILFFASFHHTQNPIKTLTECYRLLKPKGQVILMLEPSCPKHFQVFYKKHVERDTIREKYYTIKEYSSFFARAGLTFHNYNYKNFIYRDTKGSMLYYIFMNIIPNWLSNIFPCSQVIIGTKP